MSSPIRSPRRYADHLAAAVQARGAFGHRDRRGPRIPRRHRPVTRSLTIRVRWALVCAGLVTVSGAIVLAVMLVMTDRLLREGARDALGAQPQGPPRTGQAPPPAGPAADQQRLDAGHEVTTDVIRDVRAIGLITLGGLAVVSVGVGWVVAGRMLRPVHRITATAQEVSGPRLGARIALDGPDDELRRLADTFDAMLDRLDAAFAAQSAFVADAPHELRTPLTVMRAEVEVALDDPDAPSEALRRSLSRTLATLESTSDLVDRMLRLARADTLSRVEPHDLVDAARRALLGAAVTRSGSDRTHASLASAPVRGDPVLLDRLAGNLIDNAVNHNRSDGHIWVQTFVGGADAVLVVENDGSLVGDDEIPRLFDRFHRRAGAEPAGIGLGLAIVAAIVRTHGGIVEATARPAGGLRVEVRIPAAAGCGRG